MTTNNTKKTYTEEQALEAAFAMYKETVSPSKDSLVRVLNQIPEIKEKVKAVERPAIRSPYIWNRVAQVASVFVILFAIVTTLPTPAEDKAYSFYEADAEIASFEQKIDEEDYQMLLSDYTL